MTDFDTLDAAFDNLMRTLGSPTTALAEVTKFNPDQPREHDGKFGEGGAGGKEHGGAQAGRRAGGHAAGGAGKPAHGGGKEKPEAGEKLRELGHRLGEAGKEGAKDIAGKIVPHGEEAVEVAAQGAGGGGGGKKEQHPVPVHRAAAAREDALDAAWESLSNFLTAPRPTDFSKFNPDQPRDEHGRFGEGGAGPAASPMRNSPADRRNRQTAQAMEMGRKDAAKHSVHADEDHAERLLRESRQKMDALRRKPDLFREQVQHQMTYHREYQKEILRQFPNLKIPEGLRDAAPGEALDGALDTLAGFLSAPSPSDFGKFNPDQPRDEHGRWGEGAGADERLPKTAAPAPAKGKHPEDYNGRIHAFGTKQGDAGDDKPQAHGMGWVSQRNPDGSVEYRRDITAKYDKDPRYAGFRQSKPIEAHEVITQRRVGDKIETTHAVRHLNDSKDNAFPQWRDKADEAKGTSRTTAGLAAAHSDLRWRGGEDIRNPRQL